MRVTVMSVDGNPAQYGRGQFMDPDEVLLWTGRPAYGRALGQPVGAERATLAGLAVVAVAMWATYPWVEPQTLRWPVSVIWAYLLGTLGLFYVALVSAMARARVLGSLHSAVTDRRALVCLEDRGSALELGSYLISCRPTPGYRIPVLPGRPYPSLQVGTLLSEDAVQPFGSGLTHPGWPLLRGRLTCPVLFEQVPDHDHVCELIEQGALASGPWGHRDRR